MKNKQKNVAVIGLGNMGRHHARVYAELKNTNLVALLDPNQDKCKSLANQYGCIAATTLPELLKIPNLDAVNIVAPTNLHSTIAQQTLQHGCHTFIEKPITDHITTAKKIIALAKENHCKLMIGHIERFNPAVITLKKMLLKKELGKIIAIHTKRMGPFPTQIKDANIVIDLAIHDIDIVCHLLNKTPSKITAKSKNALINDREDYTEVFLDFNDEIASIQCNWICPKPKRELTLLGSKGYVELDFKEQNLSWYKTKLQKNNESTPTFFPSEEIKVNIPKKEPLKEELNHFINAISNNTPIETPGEIGLQALNISQMILNNN